MPASAITILIVIIVMLLFYLDTINDWNQPQLDILRVVESSPFNSIGGEIQLAYLEIKFLASMLKLRKINSEENMLVNILNLSSEFENKKRERENFSY